MHMSCLNLPGKNSTWFEGFAKHEFPVGGKTATLVCPRRALPGRPWAWKGEFLDSFPGTELALLEAGFHIAYLQFPDQFGGPAAMRKWDEFYDLLTGKYGFAPKPALIGLSRGGLYCYNWAARHPGRVACLFGDAPVCDMRSWPGGKGKGPGSPGNWRQAMEVYGFASEAETMAYKLNPVDNLAPLAAAAIPILHVYGDADEVVPWDENTGVVAERYRALGGHMELIAKPGGRHHPHGLDDPAPIVGFIRRHAAPSH